MTREEKSKEIIEFIDEGNLCNFKFYNLHLWEMERAELLGLICFLLKNPDVNASLPSHTKVGFHD